MKIIDAHIHYWQPDLPERPWDQGGVNIGPPLAAEQLIDDAKRAGVTMAVQITPTIMGYDNRYSIECARKYPENILGVFGRFDPTGADMPHRLEEFRRQPEILGARLTFLRPPFTAWFNDGTLDRFVIEATRLGLPIAMYAPRQPREIGALARRHPEARIFVDHMALRHQDSMPFEFWPSVMELADVPNLWMKVSYFPEASHEPYPFIKAQRYLKEIYDRFGPDRMIWGSNYPPSAAACTYRENVAFIREACDFLSESDKSKIFAETFLNAMQMASNRI